MPAERVSMRQIREVLRLRFASELPQRAIAKSLGLSQGAVSGYLSRARAAGVSWPLPADLDDEQLEALLFPPPPAIAADQRPMADSAWVHSELRRPNVTLALLWEAYRAGAPDGFGYSWFCDLYRGWAGRLKPTMRQTHIAGEKLFVDFAGRTGEVVDGLTGEIIPVQIFVAVLGASSFTYAEAVWSQKLPDWIAAHVRAFAYFGGVPRQTVSDYVPGNIIGDHLLRAAADIGEGADMGTEPVLVTLGPARFGVGQVRAGQAGNENLRLADDTLVDDAQRHAGVIDFKRLAGAMLPAHRRRPGVSLPGMEMRAELGVAVALRMPAQIFQPKQPQCHAAATQLLLDRLPIRQRTIPMARVNRREQASVKLLLAQLRHGFPVQPGRRG